VGKGNPIHEFLKAGDKTGQEKENMMPEGSDFFKGSILGTRKR
jgi:hypothetical protein